MSSDDRLTIGAQWRTVCPAFGNFEQESQPDSIAVIQQSIVHNDPPRTLAVDCGSLPHAFSSFLQYTYET